jgi:hypothetical protein
MSIENLDYTPIAHAPNNNELRLVNIEEFETHKKEFVKQKNLLSWTNGFMVTILIVVLMSFITFLLDSWKFHTEKIEEYNNLVKSLKHEKDSIKYHNLEIRILNLENKKR